jgi:uncharacterized hydrophobic protein (TIGR00271 family)
MHYAWSGRHAASHAKVIEDRPVSMQSVRRVFVDSTKQELAGTQPIRKFRNWLSGNLGIQSETKSEIYSDISQASTLLDAVYWLQIFFAAGIATLGLVLNSPAVIIGAMLISPLMGPILSGGLALSAGDLVLGIRAAVNLLLSCAVAISIAALLIWLLPFKEVTAEIAARTQPNTLDLLIALFSGAIGSISICKQSKGVVTSIPGVAIAVALMPPLCVVGFGVGVAASISGTEGWRIARGGALLFLTNLVAITFTAMIVFALLQINAAEVRKRMRPWLQQDSESVAVRALLLKMPSLGRFKWFQSLPARIAFAALGLVILAIPLSKSYIQLKQEFSRKRQENQILQAASRLCQQKPPEKDPGPRCYVGHLTVAEQGDRLVVSLRVFTRKPFSEYEKTQYLQSVSRLIHRPASSLALQLFEVPTTSGDLAAQEVKEQIKSPTVLTITELRTRLLGAIDNSLEGIQLPPPADLIDYAVSTSGSEPLQLSVSYLSDHDIGSDAQALLTAEIQSKLNFPGAVVEFKRIPFELGPERWEANGVNVSERQAAFLDLAGRELKQHASINLSVHVEQARAERSGQSQQREDAILSYLKTKWLIAPARIEFSEATGKARNPLVTLKFLKSISTKTKTR